MFFHVCVCVCACAHRYMCDCGCFSHRWLLHAHLCVRSHPALRALLGRIANTLLTGTHVLAWQEGEGGGTVGAELACAGVGVCGACVHTHHMPCSVLVACSKQGVTAMSRLTALPARVGLAFWP